VPSPPSSLCLASCPYAPLDSFRWSTLTSRPKRTKMTFLGKILAFALLFCALFNGPIMSAASQGKGISCFVCNSKFNDSCLTNPSREYLKKCDDHRDVSNEFYQKHPDQTFQACRIMYIAMGDEAPRVDRRCGLFKEQKPCMKTSTFQIKSVTCECYKDGCNPASGLIPSEMLIGLSILFTVVMRSLLKAYSA